MQAREKPKKLYEDIVEYFLQRIRTGELRPGDQLPTEKELTRQMRVSKTAVREAMSALESMGYTRSRVGEGTFVSDMSLDSILLPVSIVLSQDGALVENLLELRVILETRTAELAAQRISPEQLTELERLVEEMRREMRNEAKFIEADKQFHLLLARSTGNRVFSRIFAMCRSILDRTIVPLSQRPGQLRAACARHQDILRAVRDGDGKRAAQCMREHLEQNTESFVRQTRGAPHADRGARAPEAG